MKKIDAFRATNEQLAQALTEYEARALDDEEIVRVRADRVVLSLRACCAGEIKQKLLAARLRKTPLTRQTPHRSFPKFWNGMSTRDYVEQYAMRNADAKVLWYGPDYNGLNGEPAALYEGGAFDFEPIVEHDEQPEETAVLDLV
jgi:hypothetical protein